MNSKLIEAHLSSSIDQLIRDDLFLLKYDVHERTIAHRLAVYLEDWFVGFHVDCEYNNDLDSESGRKEIYYSSTPSEVSKVLPDIIVHHRGVNGPKHNILVIELKKRNCAPDDEERDQERLCKYTACGEEDHLSFARGALVVLGVKNDAGQYSVEWFEEGRTCEPKSRK